MRLSIELTPQEHMEIKTLAAIQGLKIRDFVLQKIFGKKKKPGFSKETLESLQDFAKGRNLKEYDNLQDLFKALKS